jgi:hypothetical protein
MKIGEYWITNDGNIPADGEYSHEDVVINTVIRKILDAIGYEDMGFDNRIEFRGWLNDVYFPDAYGWEEEDPYGKLVQKLKGVFYGDPREELSVITGTDEDARIIAINKWNWIRLAGFNAEVKDFSERTLKRLAEGILDVIYEEGFDGDEDGLMSIRVNTSTYTGRNSQNRSMSIRELLSGEGGEGGLEYSGSSKEGLRKMDTSSQPKYYGTHLGDSLTIISTLLEYDTN